MTDTSWLEVDLFSLRRNMQVWRQVVNRSRKGEERSGARLCAVVKADAYGLGAGEIGRCLDQAGIDMLAVYSPAQADELLAHPISAAILMLMPVRTRPETVRLQNAFFTGQLHLTVDSPDQLMAVHALGTSYGVEVPIHLSLDTGMSRGGLSPDQLTAILRRLPRLRHVRLAGIWSHFAAADGDASFTEEQFTRFANVIDAQRKRIPKGVLFHMAATHAALRNPKYHLSMVRIGLGMFGYGLPRWLEDQKSNQSCELVPTCFDEDEDEDIDLTSTAKFDAFETVDGHERIAMPAARLEPTVRWRSRVIHVRRYAAGATVGYGCTHELKRESFLGLVPVGYADGYPLSLSGRGCVQIVPRASGSGSGSGSGGGRSSGSAAQQVITAPILGRVNMDQIIVDLTPAIHEGEAPAALASNHACASASRSPLAQVGDMVDIISSDPASPCSLPRLAELAQSSPYEMLCRISPRVPRLYLNTAPSPALVASDRLKLSAV